MATAAALVADTNSHHAPLDGSCPVCLCSLFSEGLRVVFLSECCHYFHEDCLGRNLRVRRRTADEQEEDARSCPQCRRRMEQSELIHSVDFDLPTTGRLPQFVDTAKKLVQKLLWTSITQNAVPLLNILLNEFIRAETFNSRLGYVQAAGVIPALYYVIEQHDDGPVHSKAYYILSECLHLGDTRDCVNRLFRVDRLAVIHCKSLASDSHEAVSAALEFLQTIYKHCHPQHYDNTVMQWPRMIQSTIAAMNRHVNVVSVQIDGSKLLRDLSSNDAFIRHILRNGGLPALYAAQKAPHRVAEADECLQHLLSLDLKMA